MGVLEQWLAPLCLLASGLVWLKCRRQGVEKAENSRLAGCGAFFRTHLFWLMLGAGLLPLVAIWSGSFVQWSTMYSSLMGRIPWSDAVAYYSGAGSFLDTGELNAWTARRPMNTLLFSARYQLVGEWLERALAFQGVLAGIALFLATRKVWAVFGGAGALFFFSLAYGFHRIFGPTTLSEGLGLTVGLLAIPLLIDGVYRRSLPDYLMAALVLALGQVIRPGAIFLLPALMIWGFPGFGRKFHQRALVFAATAFAIFVPFLANKACLQFYPGTSPANSNFALTLYGLTIGTDWKGAEDALRETRLPMREGETEADAIYRDSLENMRRNPGVFVRTLGYNFGYSLARVPADVGNSLFSLGIRRGGLTAPFVAMFGVICLVLFAPATIELCARIRGRNLPRGWFWALAMAAMVATFPIIIRDGSFRVLAASYPLFLVLGAAILAGPRIRQDRTNRADYWVAGGLASVVLLGSFLLPPLARGGHPQPPNFEKSAQNAVVALRQEITAVAVVTRMDEMPSIARTFADRRAFWEIGDYRHVVEAGRLEMVPAVKRLEPPFTLALALEAETGTRKYLLLPGVAAPFREPAYEFELGEQVGRFHRVERYAPAKIAEDDATP